MAEVQSDLIHFIIDLDDDDCPDVGLHVAAFQGSLESLELQLQLPSSAEMINSRVRPFLASPLRLAATGRSMVEVSFLFDHFLCVAEMCLCSFFLDT